MPGEGCFIGVHELFTRSADPAFQALLHFRQIHHRAVHLHHSFDGGRPVQVHHLIDAVVAKEIMGSIDQFFKLIFHSLPSPRWKQARYPAILTDRLQRGRRPGGTVDPLTPGAVPVGNSRSASPSPRRPGSPPRA